MIYIYCRDTIEDVVLTKRRVFYEEEIEKNKHNYDNWFDYIRLEESVGDIDKVREVSIYIYIFIQLSNI